MAKATLTPRKTTAVTTAIPTSTTATLLDGRTLTKGALVSIKGEPGARFRFCYERLGELTFYGGRGSGDNAYHSFRTFRPDRVKTVHRNTVAANLVARATAALAGSSVESLSTGRRAAHTRRLNVAALAR